MVHRVGRGAIRELQALFDLGSTRGLGDQRLLELFIDRRDATGDAAFEALIERHGPMVHRVCLNILGNPADASDAFQATFLVLVRKRASVHRLDSLGGWLHGVACRVAARIRVELARRRVHEERASLKVHEAVEGSDPLPERAETSLAIQREVALLPEKYRSVVVLCYWEGLTQEQAADRLDCPIGTVRSRLARARDILGKRLLRRGLAPLAAIVAALGDSTTRAVVVGTVPLSLVRATVAAATATLSGHAAGGLVGSVAASIVWRMTMSKAVNVFMICSFMSAGIVGASSWALQAGREPTKQGPRPAARQAKVPPKSTGPAYVVGPTDIVLVEVLEALPGRPVSGERLVRQDGTLSLGFYGEVQVAGLTVREIKKKIVEHFRKFLTDEALGLVETDPTGAKPKKAPGPDGKLTNVAIAPEDSLTVFVDVTAYNSAKYYLEGEFVVPGRVPYTGNDTVRDAIHRGGGLLPTANRARIRLIREYPPGSETQVLPIDYDEIMVGTDRSTNYTLLPGDRVVAPRIDFPSRADEMAVPAPEIKNPDLERLEHRFDRLEAKLDRILSKLETPRPREGDRVIRRNTP